MSIMVLLINMFELKTGYIVASRLQLIDKIIAIVFFIVHIVLFSVERSLHFDMLLS